MFDFGFWQGVWTVVVMIVFVGIVAWAYSGKRKHRFEEAARIPLEDDEPVRSRAENDNG